MKLWIALFILAASFFAAANNLSSIDAINADKMNNASSINNQQPPLFEALTSQELAWLDANPNTTIATAHSWHPFIFVDHNGQLAGYNVDLIALINKNLSTSFSIKRYSSWSDAYELLMEGKIPALMSVTPTAERGKVLAFTPVYNFTPQHIVTHKSNQDISSIEDLAGKRVAVFKNHLVTDFLKKSVKTKSLHFIERINEGYSLLIAGKVDASILSNADSDKDKYKGLKIAGTIFNHSGNLSIASHKSEPTLNTILSKGILSISKEQLNSLNLKWNKSDEENTFYTDDELDYIKHNPIVKLGINNWKPIIFSEQNQTVNGILGDILNKITKTSGLIFEPVIGSTEELSQHFLHNEIDVLPTEFNHPTLNDTNEYTPNYLTINSSLFINESNNNVRSFEDLNHKKLAILSNNRHKTMIKKLFPKVELVHPANLIEALKLVTNGQVAALWEANPIIASIIKNEHVHGVKQISQPDTLPNALSMKIQPTAPILRSILNKSLMLISQSRKKIIVDDWVQSTHLKAGVNLALGIGREPFTLEHPNIRGIEFDLMYRILKHQGIEIYNTINLSEPLLIQSLSNNAQLDAKVTVKPQNDQYFYSDPFISFNNVVVSRQQDHLNFMHPTDLKGKHVLAFSGASKYLGQAYHALFNIHDRPDHYREYKFQQQQVEAFIKGTADAIVIDLDIFKWYAKSLGHNDLSDYRTHDIFHKNNTFTVGFRDKYLRDRFNIGLEHIKASGEYQYIIDQYSHNLVQSKVDISQLFSAIIANDLFTKDTLPLKNLLDKLVSLPFIERIDVLDNQNNLIAQSISTAKNPYFKQQNIINIFDKLATTKGYLNVYFNDEYIKSHYHNTSLIPDLQFFSDMKRFKYISAIYRRLNHINNALNFSIQEQRYLDSHPIIKFSEVNWRPLSIVENGKFSGLMADYMDIISTKTGIEFTLKKEKTWPDVITAFQKHEIDLIPGITDIEQHASNGLISNEFSFFNFAIIMGENASFVDTLSDLTGKKIALPKDDPIYYFIKKKYPEAQIIETDSMNQALILVSQHKADAFIGHMAVAIYQLETRFPHLKIVGQLDTGFSHRILVHNDQPILLSIINKVLSSIDDSTHDEIRQRWVKRSIKTAIDYQILYIIVLVFSLISLVFIYSYRRINRASKQVEKSHDKLSRSMLALEEQKNIFETLFYETTDGLLLMKEGRYIDCNNSVLVMLGYQYKEQLIGQSPSGISPLYQPCGSESKLLSKLIERQCKTQGHNKFEWVFQDIKQVSFWVEIVLTTITLNNEELVHIVWRDISDKKQLEQENFKHNSQLISANKELERSIKHLKNAQQQLIESEKMASLGGLVAGVAHEINTPVGIGLTAVTHFLEINKDIREKYQQQNMKKSDFTKYLEASKEIAILLNRNLERTAQLVSSFKQVSVDQTSDQSRTFNVSAYINEILTSIYHVIKNTKIKISVSCDDKLTITSFPGAISQIISNLVINASIHAFPSQEGTISIEVTHVKEILTLVIKDNGIGISQHNISKIFEPFYTTNRDNGGSGLGLNIVYNIVTTQLSGSIRCDSEIDNGTTFTINLSVVINEE